PKTLMELDHQQLRGVGVHPPLADYGRRTAGNEKSPRQSHDPLAGADLSVAAVARRENGNLRSDVEIENLARFEQAILSVTGIGGQYDRRVHGRSVVDDAVRGQMKNAATRCLRLEHRLARGIAHVSACSTWRVEG